MKLENTMQLLWMQTVLSSCSYVFLKLGWQLPLGAGCATLCTQFMIAFRAPVKKNVVVLSGRRRPVNLITQPTDNGDISKDTEKVREIIQRLTDTWSYMRAHRLVKTLVQCFFAWMSLSWVPWNHWNHQFSKKVNPCRTRKTVLSPNPCSLKNMFFRVLL